MLCLEQLLHNDHVVLHNCSIIETEQLQSGYPKQVHILLVDQQLIIPLVNNTLLNYCHTYYSTYVPTTSELYYIKLPNDTEFIGAKT